MPRLTTPTLGEVPYGLRRQVARASKLAVQSLDGMRALRWSFGEQYAYGHREVLLKSANIDLSAHIAGGIQHGVWHGAGLQIPDLRDRWGRRPKYYVWSSDVHEHLPKGLRRRVLPIGSPWLYLLRALQSDTQPRSSGTLSGPYAKAAPYRYVFFPAHSTPDEFELGAATAHARIADAYRELAPPSEPSLVCLYWVDYLEPLVRLTYESRGFSVVTAGVGWGVMTPWSPTGGRVRFLLNLRDIMLSADTVVSDIYATAAAYALSLGRRVIFRPDLMRDRVLHIGRPIASLESHRTEIDWTERLLSDFPQSRDVGSNEDDLRDFALIGLGASSLMSSEELRSALDYREGVVPDLPDQPW